MLSTRFIERVHQSARLIIGNEDFRKIDQAKADDRANDRVDLNDSPNTYQRSSLLIAEYGNNGNFHVGDDALEHRPRCNLENEWEK